MQTKPLAFGLMPVALALAGCSSGEDQAVGEEPTAVPADRVPPVARVRPALSTEDLQAELAGELGCSFVENGSEAPLLIAMADVTDESRAEGLMKLGPSTLRLRGAGAGGFDAMVRGASFESGDLTATVVVTSQTPVGGGEAPPLPARLEIATAGTGMQQIEGLWSCGP